MAQHELRKQTTTISARRLREQLEAEGYQAAYWPKGKRPAVKPTVKAAVKAAEAIFGQGVKTSGGGHMVTMSFNNISVDVPVQHMLGHGALDAIQKRTGLTFTA
jgi:hypothetical protein